MGGEWTPVKPASLNTSMNRSDWKLETLPVRSTYNSAPACTWKELFGIKGILLRQILGTLSEGSRSVSLGRSCPRVPRSIDGSSGKTSQQFGRCFWLKSGRIHGIRRDFPRARSIKRRRIRSYGADRAQLERNSLSQRLRGRLLLTRLTFLSVGPPCSSSRIKRIMGRSFLSRFESPARTVEQIWSSKLFGVYEAAVPSTGRQNPRRKTSSRHSGGRKFWMWTVEVNRAGGGGNYFGIRRVITTKYVVSSK